jgi:hypothetical protein
MQKRAFSLILASCLQAGRRSEGLPASGGFTPESIRDAIGDQGNRSNASPSLLTRALSEI